VLDEVQTGFCRTGAMFACEHFGVVPDILCLAKAMGGGMPIGAVVCSDRVHIPVGRHGSTFGGNPLSCAASRAAIDVMVEEGLAERSRRLGDRLAGRLRRAELGKVREVRHMGLMVGVELREKVAPYILALLDAGLLTFPAGATVIRVYPPLTIEEPQLDAVAERLERVLA
jgi:acetylornithine/LysW-gamma-L-lysine aminotransferase